MERHLDLGEHALANSFHDGSGKQPRFPLEVAVCPQCWHNQLTVAVDPAKMFKEYLYVSGTSEFFLDYFKSFAEKATAQRGGAGSVCDIGCNDGSQLDAFAKLGWRTFGVDPSENLASRRESGGHKTITGFWSAAAARQLREQFGVKEVDVLTAQNVFAHTAEVEEFLAACKLLMSPSSRLLIQTGQAMMFENNEFDAIYHEHISYFSVSSMSALAKRAGFILQDAEMTDLHGKSHLFTLMPDAPQTLKASPNVGKLLRAESWRYERGFYSRFAENVAGTINKFNKTVEALRGEGRKLVGLGASARGMTFLNSARCRLDYILDRSPLKQGLLTPGSNIPIVAQEKIREEKHPVALIPLSWGLFNEILAQVCEMAPELEYVAVRYIPKVKIEKSIVNKEVCGND